jgi:hypothetical protein
VLDFVHLLTYIYQAAQAAGGGAKRRWERYERWLHWAWGGERAPLLSALTRASGRAGKPLRNAAESDPRRVLASARTYVINDLDKMDYPRYRKLGLPTSSAPVESEIKQFNRRVKGTEKLWTEEGAARRVPEPGRPGRPQLGATPPALPRRGPQPTRAGQLRSSCCHAPQFRGRVTSQFP